jgi:hypothetical protein
VFAQSGGTRGFLRNCTIIKGTTPTGATSLGTTGGNGSCTVIGLSGAFAAVSYFACTLVGVYFVIENGSTAANATIEDCVQWGNSTVAYGVVSQLAAPIRTVRIIRSAFGGNTSGNFSSTISTSGDPTMVVNCVSLTVSPFNASDYGLNTTAGGGAACRGIQKIVEGLSTYSYVRLGAIQPQTIGYNSLGCGPLGGAPWA